jgi:hypothetical protein
MTNPLSDTLDTNIDNYQIKDILNLFKLDFNFNEDDLEQVKQKVIGLHPSNSDLPEDYFIFFRAAYKRIQFAYEVRCTTQTKMYAADMTSAADMTTAAADMTSSVNPNGTITAASILAPYPASSYVIKSPHMNTVQMSNSVLPKQVFSSNYKVYQFIADSKDRNTTIFPDANQFILESTESFKNVFAIRLLKSDLNYIAAIRGNGLYIYLNDYKLLYRNTEQDNIRMFSKINSGIENHNCITSNILDDPYTYIMNPIEGKLKKFDIKCYDENNTITTDTKFNLVLHLALFCYTPSLSS